MPTKPGFWKNIEEYAAQSSIHGVGYIFDKKLGFVDRALWLVATLCAVTVAISMIISTYKNWQNDQVITTLKTTSKPVTDLEFPSVTICGNGLHMDLVEKVLYDNFNNWKSQEDPSISFGSIQEEYAEFMNETF